MTLPLGRASWSRISSASDPPIRKNMNEVAPYSFPMRLWSTVVNQLQRPVVALGRAKMARRRKAIWSSVVTVATRRSPPSRQTLEIGHQRVQGRGAELVLEDGHIGP